MMLHAKYKLKSTLFNKKKKHNNKKKYKYNSGIVSNIAVCMVVIYGFT